MSKLSASVQVDAHHVADIDVVRGIIKPSVVSLHVHRPGPGPGSGIVLMMTPEQTARLGRALLRMAERARTAKR